jgi:hypothetical protein
MNYCRAIVNFYRTLNSWKSEDKLQNWSDNSWPLYGLIKLKNDQG